MVSEGKKNFPIYTPGRIFGKLRDSIHEYTSHKTPVRLWRPEFRIGRAYSMLFHGYFEDKLVTTL